MKPIKVLSLFDGIACGRVALERAGIPVEKYDAFEIDKYAIQVANKNYGEIIQHGDVFDGDFTEFSGYDLLLGGSPCTFWSIMKKGREITADGEGFRLFKQFVRAKQESRCKYFLYENNYSIHKNIKAEITRQLGVEPIMIDSALVSAQHRKRCYWTNIPGIEQPTDRGIKLQDILEGAIPWQEKSYCLTAAYPGAEIKNTLKTNQRTMVAVPINSYNNNGFKGRATAIANPIRTGEAGKIGQEQRIYSIRGKTVTISSGEQGAKTESYKIDLPDGDYKIRKLTPVEAERLQTLPDNYTEGLSNTQRYKCLGNGWTVDVIAHILSYIKEEF